jgi:hypothetical protein
MRIGEHNVIAILAAGAAFWVLGAAWFGFIFQDAWMTGAGITEAEFENSNPAWMGLGVVISFVTAIGLSIVLRWGGLPDLVGALKRTALIWVGFGATYALYNTTYWPEHSIGLFLVMGGYTLVGWLIMAAILAVLK